MLSLSRAREARKWRLKRRLDRLDRGMRIRRLFAAIIQPRASRLRLASDGRCSLHQLTIRFRGGGGVVNPVGTLSL